MADDSVNSGKNKPRLIPTDKKEGQTGVWFKISAEEVKKKKNKCVRIITPLDTKERWRTELSRARLATSFG